MAYELIETVEVGSGGASSIEFTSIPQDGTDLVVKLSTRIDDTGNFGITFISLNSSTADFSSVRLFGNGSSASSGTGTRIVRGTPVGNGATANTFSNAQIYISNYASSSAKSISIDAVTENNDTQSAQSLQAMNWDDTSAITSILLEPSPYNYLQYSTASLYKITAA